MFNLKSKLVGAALGCAMLSTGANAAFLSYWIDPDGAGAGDALRVNEFIDINSGFLGENFNIVGNNFDFNQYGLARISGINGGTLIDIFNNETAATFAAFGGASAQYSGSGTGDFSTGSFAFGTGSIQFFDLNNVMFADFNVVGGGGLLDVTSGVPNGQATLIGQAVSFAVGYLFADNGGVMGADFSTFSPGQLLDTFGFSTTNASLITDQGQRDTLDTALSAAYPGEAFVQNADGANLFDVNGNPTQFYVAANGQFRLNQVPEPGTIALLGLGLLGLAASRRRATK